MINQDRSRLDFIRSYYETNGIMPTLRCICEGCNYSSNNAAHKLVKRLIKTGHLKKIGSRIAPDNLFMD